MSHGEPDRHSLVSPIVIFEGSPVGGSPDPAPDDRVAEARWVTDRPAPLLSDALADFPMPSADESA